MNLRQMDVARQVPERSSGYAAAQVGVRVITVQTNDATTVEFYEGRCARQSLQVGMDLRNDRGHAMSAVGSAHIRVLLQPI